MSKDPSNPDREQLRGVRVLLVDHACVPAAALAAAISRMGGTIIPASEAVPEEVAPVLLEPFILDDFKDLPAKHALPRNRQGKDYESVFRRPRGRQRR